MDERAERVARWEEAYERLNDNQRQAVDAIEGPVMVIAGPGTGKTQILTLRIANILLKTDTQPENILALTFTESGARAMRARLRHFIGSAAYRVPINTFHGLAEQLIGQYPEHFPQIIGGRAASELERALLIEDIVAAPDLALFAPAGNPRYYVKPILAEISHLKREGVSPDTFATYVKNQAEALTAVPRYHESGRHEGKERGEYQKAATALARNEALLLVYRQYEAALRAALWYDFDDMIAQVVTALAAQPDFKQILQEQYQYVLADEHQDVNGSQNRLLELLTDYHEQPNIFVVGDEKQAIYRFQGASLDNFLYFEARFGQTTTITLTDNYRSGQTILDAAHGIVLVDDPELAKLRQPLTAAATAAGSVKLGSFTHQAVEDAVVVEQIQALLKQAVPPSEIAVLLRTNREVEEMAAALRRAGVPVAASAESDVLTHPLTRTVLDLVTAADRPEDEAALARVLHQPQWGLTGADIATLLSARAPGERLSTLLSDQERLATLPLSDASRPPHIMATLDTARAATATTAPHRVVAGMIEQSGLLTHATTVAARESSRILRRLYDELASEVERGGITTLTDVITQLGRLPEYGLALTAPLIKSDEAAVAVMTAHKAKGLEFAHVFVPHLTDRTWGGRTRRRLFTIDLTRATVGSALDEEDDERRLFYVALTRAKEAVYLSYANTRADGRELLGSRLLERLPAAHVTTDTHNETAFDPADVLHPATGTDITTAWLVDVLKERGLSATALNNYRQSPWTYLYRNVLRLPEVPSLPLLYGTAVHSVLNDMLTHWTETNALPTITELVKLITRALGRLPTHKEEYTRLHEAALTSLTVYQEHLAEQLTPHSQGEVKLTATLPTGLNEFPELTLTGALDRLDFAADGTLERVTDYKTGKPKSRNAIEGKTKASDGNYHRQLVFYALLLSLQEEPRWHCRTGVLSFVEPDRHGQIREETYEISEAEIAALKDELIQIVADITSGKLFTTPCDPERSDYCDLAAALMRREGVA
jgi:DNA helicase-2/ATP-dependent DNA helicase PcrA